MRLGKSIKARAILVLTFLSLILASLPQSPFYIPEARAQIGAIYTQVTDIISWTGDCYSPDDLWQDDIAATGSGGKLLKASSVYTTNGTMSLTTQPTPTDYYEVKLNVVVTVITGTVTFTFVGKDEYGVAVSDTLTLSAVTTYKTTKRFKSVNSNGITRAGFDAGESVTCSITQDRWGEVWKIRDGLDFQYKFDCNLKVGDGSTASTLSWSSVYFTMASAKKITVTNNAILTFGGVITEADKTVGYGVTMIAGGVNNIIDGQDGSSVYLYGSHFVGITISLGGADGRIWGCLFDGGLLKGAENTDIFNIFMFNGIYFYPVTYTLANATFNKITLTDSTKDIVTLVQAITQDITLTNIYGRDNSYVVGIGLVISELSTDVAFIDADIDSWVFDFDELNHLYVGEIWRQYSFDLTVTYQNGTAFSGANVTISHYGQGGGTDYTGTTDGSGEIVTQTLTYGFYNDTGDNTIYDYNPYQLTITASGYQTYTKNFTLIAKTDWAIALLEETITPTEPFITIGAFVFLILGLVVGAVIFEAKRK